MTSELLEGEMLEHFAMPDGEAPLRRVVSVTPVAPGEAFCFDEPKNHTGTFNGVVTGQSEILLRPRQFCNLTEVVVRASDTLQDLARKVRICTHLGGAPAEKFAPGTSQGMTADWPGGFLCPCHGSIFDLAGRVYLSQPAPTNLEIPPHKWLSAGVLLIGEDDQGAA